MTMRIPPTQSRFGFATAPAVLKTFDFATLGATTTAQSKFLYTTCIGSRVVQGRSMRERWETLRRDLLGWYFWFKGNHLIQSLAMMIIIPVMAKPAKKLLVRDMSPQAGILERAKWFFLNPAKLWLMTTDKQLEQREVHIVDNLVAKVSKHNTPENRSALQAAKAVFEQAKNIRGLTSAFGFVFNIFLLGWGIMQLNIFLTKSSVQKQQAQKALQEKMRQRDQIAAESVQPEKQSAPGVNPGNLYWPAQNGPNPFLNTGYPLYPAYNRF